MLKTTIKASAITNLTDARYFAAWGVEWLGFCLDPAAPEYIAPSKIKAIREWVEGPKVVGEFGLQSASEIVTAVSEIGLDAVQLNQFGPVSEISTDLTVPVFQEWICESAGQLNQLVDLCQTNRDAVDFFILNCSKNNIRWPALSQGPALDHLKTLCNDHQLILDFPGTPEELAVVLQSVHLSGLQVKGGEEEKTGFKSFDELDDLFDFLAD